MTDPTKPRWTADEKRVARDARRGKESRANYHGSREDRRFGVGMTNGQARRASNGANSSSAITISGSPVIYGTPYEVWDQFGSFTEVVQAGAVKAILATADCRFLYDHKGLTLARTTSGTLTLTDTPASLNCVATLDPRQTVAADLALAVGRGDVREMSVGFIVGADEWSSDFSHRLITRFGELLDVSAVAFPASPTTSIELLDQPENLAPVGGPDGTLGGGGGNAPGIGNEDGTGARSRNIARIIQIDQDLLSLGRPPLRI
jgi:HK97 family phage prohead protease